MTQRWAEAVCHPAQPWRLSRVVWALLSGVVCVVWAVWAWWRPDLPPAWWLGLGLAVLWLLLARPAAPDATGVLSWDPGAGWHWQQPPVRPRPLARVERVAHGADWCWVRAHGLHDGAVLWLCCRAGDERTWRALQRALTAHAATPRSAIVGARRPTP